MLPIRYTHNGPLVLLLSSIYALTFASPRRVPVKSLSRYEAVQRQLAAGWNTWNTNSMLSHVLLPEGFALNLGIRKVSRNSEMYLRETLIGRPNEEAERVYPGPHAYDGSYTELIIEWKGI